jgi:hypothetical protein
VKWGGKTKCLSTTSDADGEGPQKLCSGGKLRSDYVRQAERNCYIKVI